MLDALRTEIAEGVSRYCGEPSHREAVLAALRRPGFALHAESQSRAGVLTLEVYRAIRGDLEGTAWRAAAAVELYQEAAFLFDDVADDDVDPALASNTAIELALAITLMNCAVAAACDAAVMSGASASGLFAVQNLVRNCIAACAGQHMDAALALREASTTTEALKMTELKAGGCGRLAASFGAELATEDEELRSLFSDLGFNIFVYLQLVDDLRDAYPAEGTPTDLLQGKKTVPLAYFRGAVPEKRATGSDGIMNQDDNDSGYRRKFDESGANAFGAVVAEAYLNQAKANLADLSARLGSLDRLERFIESLEFSPQEIPSAQ